MALPRFGDLHLKRLEEIESNVRKFMVLQFEHNNFFRNELKDQKSFMSFMNKELDDMSKEFDGFKSQIAHLEKLIAEVSDKQATLVNKMAAKPEDLDDNKDEDLKVIDVSPIKSLFCNMNLDNDGTEYDPPLPRRLSKNSEFLDLDNFFLVKRGLERSKLYIAMNPLFWISRNLIMIIAL